MIQTMLHTCVSLALTTMIASADVPEWPIPPFDDPAEMFPHPEGWTPTDPGEWAFPEMPPLPPLDAHIHRVPSEYDSIQDAIDAASDGHTVLLEQTAYFENISIEGKVINLKSGIGGSTIFPAADELVLFIHSADLDDPVTLTDLTFQSTLSIPVGFDPMTGAPIMVEIVYPSGAGVLAWQSAVQLERCTFQKLNHDAATMSFYGSGLTAIASVVEMNDCEFTECHAAQGGAVAGYQSIVVMDYCTVRDCTSDGSGAGVGLWSSFGGLSGCTFEDNAAYSSGGGVYLDGGATLAFLQRCVFYGNSAAWGGAGCAEGDVDDDVAVTVTECRFRLNEAGEYGDHWYGQNATGGISDSSMCGHDDATTGVVAPPFNNEMHDTCTFCPGDLDGSEYIDTDDLLEVIGQFGTADPISDVDQDGEVDVRDLLYVLTYWGDCWTIDWGGFEDPWEDFPWDEFEFPL